MPKGLLKQFRETATALRQDARREYLGTLFDAVNKALPYQNTVLTSEYPSDEILRSSFVYAHAWSTQGNTSNHLRITLSNGWDFSRNESETLAHFHVKQRKGELDIVLLGENGKPVSGNPFFTIASGRTRPTKADEEKLFSHIINLFPKAVQKVHASKKACDDTPSGGLF